jgi:hypothetical protein
MHISGKRKPVRDAEGRRTASIKQIDKRYRQRYQVSLIENAIRIKTVGTEQFQLEEQQKWTCTQCGGLICLPSASALIAARRGKILSEKI